LIIALFSVESRADSATRKFSLFEPFRRCAGPQAAPTFPPAMIVLELLPLAHAALGVAGTLAAFWCFVETLNAAESNRLRIRLSAALACAWVFATAGMAGWQYVVRYPASKALLVASESWSWTHQIVMETKEHLFFSMVLLALYLPLAAARLDPVHNRDHRTLLLTVSGTIVLLGLAMEGLGGLLALGIRGALAEAIR
jgi:hypothetical protein